MALKPNWIRVFTVAGVGGYFVLATYFDRTHVDLSPLGKVVIPLNSPFFHEGGFAHRVSNLPQGEATLLGKIQADDPTNLHDTSSPIQLYEGQTPLGPSHSTFRAISKTGRGHFAHWSGRGIFFSSSDNTDPNKNGRRYWAVVP
jgi:hypothetical protein